MDVHACVLLGFCVCVLAQVICVTFSSKVTFHTPMRDSQTHRILSPDKRKIPETPVIGGDCTDIPEDFVLSASSAV